MGRTGSLGLAFRPETVSWQEPVADLKAAGRE
jgi:hypothetical protein